MSTEDLGGPVYIDQMDPNNRWYDPKKARDVSPFESTIWPTWDRGSILEPGRAGYRLQVPEQPSFYNPYPIIPKDEKLEPGVDWKNQPPVDFDWDRWDWKRKASGERSEPVRRRVSIAEVFIYGLSIAAMMILAWIAWGPRA